jgi:hypothetical protein
MMTGMRAKPWRATDPAQHFHAVQPRHHAVEHEQVEFLLDIFEQGPRLDPSCATVELDVRGRRDRPDDLDVAGLVIDDQHSYFR